MQHLNYFGIKNKKYMIFINLSNIHTVIFTKWCNQMISMNANTLWTRIDITYPAI